MCDGGDRAVPELARDVVGAYLSAVGEEAPGLVEGLYLTGSVRPARTGIGVTSRQAIISKAAAGDYARDRFDARWHPIVAEALRIRRGDTDPRGYRDPLRRRRDTLAFMDHVIEDAHGIGEHQTGEAGGTSGTGRGGDTGPTA